jgi:putative Ca2+/H+ antiporter (TMEM165/GDT1 family)
VDGFLLALLLTAALACGGRDQWLVAGLADHFGRSIPLLGVALVCACLSAGVMAFAGAQVAALLPHRAALMLVAFALAFGAVELAWPVRPEAPREPTRSLAALALVLLSRQIGDGARFAVFALAAWASWPLTAGLGGALGGAGAVALGWSLGAERLARWPFRRVRLVLAAGLLVAALFIGLNARFAAY